MTTWQKNTKFTKSSALFFGGGRCGSGRVELGAQEGEPGRRRGGDTIGPNMRLLRKPEAVECAWLPVPLNWPRSRCGSAAAGATKGRRSCIIFLSRFVNIGLSSQQGGGTDPKAPAFYTVAEGGRLGKDFPKAGRARITRAGHLLRGWGDAPETQSRVSRPFSPSDRYLAVSGLVSSQWGNPTRRLLLLSMDLTKTFPGGRNLEAPCGIVLGRRNVVQNC